MRSLFLLLFAVAPFETWGYRTARMEGAAGDLKESAAALRATASGVATAGRVKDVALLRSQADALHRKVVSAGLAAANLDQIDGGVETLRQLSTPPDTETSQPPPETPDDL